jgi:ABC-type phosphate transport system auxiliary subunit
MKHRIQIIGLVAVVVVQGLGNLWMTANHNAQLKASTEAHNAQLMAQAEVHNAQLLEQNERFKTQLVAQAAAYQKK